MNGTTVAPTSGLTDASLTFLVPVTPGAYEVRFFADNSSARLATSGLLTAEPSPAALTVNGGAPPAAVSVVAGSTVSVGVSDGPAHAGDWGGLYAAGSADSAYLTWLLQATATVSGGTIARVDFFDGATAVGTATALPYQTTWIAPALGSHTLTAVATDHTGAITTSSPVSVSVVASGVGFGTLGAPIASPPAGVYGPGQTVTLTAAPGASIRYTLDGSEPNESSSLYTGPTTLASTATVTTAAFQTGWAPPSRLRRRRRWCAPSSTPDCGIKTLARLEVGRAKTGHRGRLRRDVTLRSGRQCGEWPVRRIQGSGAGIGGGFGHHSAARDALTGITAPGRPSLRWTSDEASMPLEPADDSD